MTVALASPVGERKVVAERRHFTPPPSMKKLGARMREARGRRNMSQSDVARLLDLRKQTVSGWELGVSPPQLDNLIRFAAIMDMDMAELFHGLSEDLAPSDRLSRRLSAASRLVPLYEDIESAGAKIMHAEKRIEPASYIKTLVADQHAVAFTVKGQAMATRFSEGDVITVLPVTMAEPGALVVAWVAERFVFRKFLPKVEGKAEGATLRALNPSYPDIEMRKGDAVVARFAESVSSRQE